MTDKRIVLAKQMAFIDTGDLIMLSKTIDSMHVKSSTICQALESIPLSSIRQILPDRAILEACRQADYRYRRRLITPVVIVLHMLLASIWPEESFHASWQVLWSAFKSRHPECSNPSPSRGDVAKARARLPLAVWRHLFAWVSQQAQQLSRPWARWRSHRVVLVDGTCVSMPDTPSLQAAFGTQSDRARYPLARLVALSLAHTMTVISYAVGGYRQDENTPLEPLLQTLQEGDLLVADRHFAGAHLYVRYQRAGLEFITRMHQRLILSRVRRFRKNGKNDFVGRLKINPLYCRQDPSLPAWIQVRFIGYRIRVRGRMQTLWLVTSLLDARRYPALEIAEIFGRRWRIETLFGNLKIKLSADVLRSQSPEAVHKETAARMMALNVVRSLMLQAAAEHGVEPQRLSFTYALRAVVSFTPALGIEPLWKVPAIYRAMLREIAAHEVEWRPGRNEPRMIRRDPKHYPRLMMTREEWRNAYAA